MDIVDKLYITGNLTDVELFDLLQTDKYDTALFKKAGSRRREIYGTDVYIRGLIEFTNYCKNDCLYCGIRKSNQCPPRYRLTADEIYECCNRGYELGFRTFVLQGGEDPFFTDDALCKIVYNIKNKFPACAVTLSVGERSYKSYKALFSAGASRYLLRHETASPAHYAKLHPETMSFSNRQRCLFDLKEIGYQTGSGFMVGSPFQTTENIVADLRFLQKLNPHMIGIGPFIKHTQTPFADFQNGSLALTLRLIAVLRLMFPYGLIPSTTALATLDPAGRLAGLKAGANVVMPNLSPTEAKQSYTLYDNKLSSGAEDAEQLLCLKHQVESVGYKVTCHIGDAKQPKGSDI